MVDPSAAYPEVAEGMGPGAGHTEGAAQVGQQQVDAEGVAAMVKELPEG